MSETEAAAPESVYGASKRYVEIAGEHYRRQGRVSFVALRLAMVVGPGVESAASGWRGKIFEALRARKPTAVSLPYAPHELLPLIHVIDVAEIVRGLVDATQTRHARYNTPAETWGRGFGRCGGRPEWEPAIRVWPRSRA